MSRMLNFAALFLAASQLAISASADELIQGRVEANNAPIGGAEVTAWRAGPDAPTKIVAAKTKDDGTFEMTLPDQHSDGTVLYLVAEGGATGGKPNSASVLMALLGTRAPLQVVINDLTTVASVWAATQFLDGIAISGNEIGLKIAAGNVPNLVDLETGNLGQVVMNPLNGPRTTTLAKMNTLGLLISACATAKLNACDTLFDAATPPGAAAPTNTLQAAQNIARNPAHNAVEIFALLDALYPVPAGKRYRDNSRIPYLTFAPSAWTLSLVHGGGGFFGVGGAVIDGEGNFWSNNNWLAGSQTTIFDQFGGGIGKIAPDGTPLSPMITGFLGGGLYSPGWGIAISEDDKVWASNLIGSTISVLDRKTGEPLSPETGYNFDGKLGQMQGVAIAPNGDIWTVDTGHSQIVHIPQGDPSKGYILGQTVDGKPADGTLTVKNPFGISIDHQDRIWIGNSGSNTVIRFPANDPGKAEEFEVGYSPHGIAIDSQGNAWVANLVGHPGTAEKLAIIKQKIEAKAEEMQGSMTDDEVAIKGWIDLWSIINEHPGGDISMITPDGVVHGPFNADGAITGPWGIAIDGNDNVWVASSTSHSITQLCGVRTDTCPSDLKTGDPITPSQGYIGGLQIIAPIALDPAGNAWVGNGWNDTDAGFQETPPEAQSTRFPAHTNVVFLGVAKPVKTPLIGPVRVP